MNQWIWEGSTTLYYIVQLTNMPPSPYQDSRIMPEPEGLGRAVKLSYNTHDCRLQIQDARPEPA